MPAHNFKGDRLKKARMYRAMTLTDLAARTNLSKQALSQYENGTTIPVMSNLFALSTALNFPVEYFSIVANIKCDVEQSEATYFRSLLSTTKKDRLAQSVRLEFIAQIYAVLRGYVNFPTLSLPDVSFSDYLCWSEFDEAHESEQIELIATQVRQSWELGDAPIENLRFALEERGIVIICTDINALKIDAFSQRILVNNNENYFIVISKDRQSIARARFDMAHELAHILLHPWSEDLESISKDDFRARERQANTLASAFLLPRSTFAPDIMCYPTNLDYYLHLKKKWAVSVKAMIYRTHKLGIISTNQYQYLMRQYSRNGWNSGEPDDLPYSPTSTLLKSAVKLIFKEGVVTVEGFLSALKMRGVALHPSEIEEILCLDKGTLTPISAPRGQIISLKSIAD